MNTKLIFLSFYFVKGQAIKLIKTLNIGNPNYEVKPTYYKKKLFKLH